MKTNIHVWHLELCDIDQAPSNHQLRPYTLTRVGINLPEFNRFLYASVGASVMWYMRRHWRYEEWQAFLSQPGVETWVAYQKGVPIGYFELAAQASKSTEICYFGILPQFIGQSLGKLFLEDAIGQAWRLGGKRVWLHTCTLDHASALPNYLARGFKIFKEEDCSEAIPTEPLQPWEGANKFIEDS